MPEKPTFVNYLALAGFLVVAWLLFSGYFLPLILFLGAISVVFVVYIVHRMDIADHEGAPIHITADILLYLPWLLWQIILSNIAVTKCVLGPRDAVSPVLFRAPMSQKTPLGHVIYANSITLTPGTVSVHMEEDTVLVHALEQAGADDVLSNAMDARVTRMEG